MLVQVDESEEMGLGLLLELAVDNPPGGQSDGIAQLPPHLNQGLRLLNKNRGFLLPVIRLSFSRSSPMIEDNDENAWISKCLKWCFSN